MGHAALVQHLRDLLREVTFKTGVTLDVRSPAAREEPAARRILAKLFGSLLGRRRGNATDVSPVEVAVVVPEDRLFSLAKELTARLYQDPSLTLAQVILHEQPTYEESLRGRMWKETTFEGKAGALSFKLRLLNAARLDDTLSKGSAERRGDECV
jgi:hypothetical protein